MVLNPILAQVFPFIQSALNDDGLSDHTVTLHESRSFEAVRDTLSHLVGAVEDCDPQQHSTPCGG